MIGFSIERPWLTVLLWLAIIGGLAAGMKQMSMDPDIAGDLDDSLPEKQLYDRVGKMFPSREFVFLAVVPEDGRSPFTADVLWQVHRLTEALRDLPEVQDVQSPTNARIITGNSNGITIRTAGKPLPVSGSAIAAFKRRLRSQEQLRGTAVSRDEKALAIMVFFKNKVVETKAAGRVIKLVKRHLVQFQGMKAPPKELVRGGWKPAGQAVSGGGVLRRIKVHATGRSAVTYLAGATMGKEMGILSSLAVLVIVVLLLATFRSGRGVGLPMLVVIGSTLATLGAMSWIKVGITHSTQMLPILIISIGVADGIHLLKFYYLHAKGATDRVKVVGAMMKDMAPPVIMTSLTTSAGFMALNTAGLPSVAVLGMSTAFGVMVAMFLSISLVPALLVLLPIPRRLREAGVGSGRSLSERMMGGWAGSLMRFKIPVLVGLGLLVVLLGLGMTRLEAGMSMAGNFKPGHPIREAVRVVNAHFMGGTTMQIVFQGKPGFVHRPAFLRRIDRMEARLRKMEGVGGVMSATMLVKQMNQVLSGGKGSAWRIPREKEPRMGQRVVLIRGQEQLQEYRFEARGRDLVRDYLNTFSMQAGRKMMNNMVTPERDAFKLTVFFTTDQQRVQRRAIIRIRKELATGFASVGGAGKGAPPKVAFPEVKADLTGMSVLILTVTGRLIKGQSLSILVSLGLVFLLTTLMFRSPTLGLFNTLPLGGTLAVNFGIMGLLEIPINEITISVSSVAIGVGVDYGIHFVHRVREKIRETGSHEEAVRQAFGDSGVAIVFNALTVAAGFATIMAATFQGLVIMGFLLTATMIASAFNALTVLPVIFAVFRPSSLSRGSGQEPTEGEKR